jgi:hypothetical protein
MNSKPVTLETAYRGMIVALAIPASRPIKLLSGVLHEGGSRYTVLGLHGTLLRLSRTTDREKLMVTPDMVVAVDANVEFVSVPFTKTATLEGGTAVEWTAPETFNGLELTSAVGRLASGRSFVTTATAPAPVALCVTRRSNGVPFLVCADITTN